MAPNNEDGIRQGNLLKKFNKNLPDSVEFYVINNVFQTIKCKGDGRFMCYFSRAKVESIMFCCSKYGKNLSPHNSSLRGKMNGKYLD